MLRNRIEPRRHRNGKEEDLSVFVILAPDDKDDPNEDELLFSEDSLIAEAKCLLSQRDAALRKAGENSLEQQGETPFLDCSAIRSRDAGMKYVEYWLDASTPEFFDGRLVS